MVGLIKLKPCFLTPYHRSLPIMGADVGYYFANKITGFASILMPIAAGGFIYIASCNLVPEIHKQADIRKSVPATATFTFGIVLIYLL